MPGIHGRGPSDRLLAALLMFDEIRELAIRSKSPGIQLINGVADAVALVGFAVRIAGIGGLGHPDTDEAHRNFPGEELEGDGPALAVRNNAGWKCLPDPFRCPVIKRLFGAGPKLN
jgi:hypothetical protein